MWPDKVLLQSIDIAETGAALIEWEMPIKEEVVEITFMSAIFDLDNFLTKRTRHFGLFNHIDQFLVCP